jgi:hypothetical protein
MGTEKAGSFGEIEAKAIWRLEFFYFIYLISKWIISGENNRDTREL